MDVVVTQLRSWRIYCGRGDIDSAADAAAIYHGSALLDFFSRCAIGRARDCTSAPAVRCLAVGG